MNPESVMECTHSLLLVDDEENILNSLKRTFRKEQYRIVTAQSGMEGLSVIDREKISLVLSDHRMPGMEGVEFLNEVRQKSPDTIRMMLTGYADMQSVMNAINHGEVYRFITKPWDDEEIRFIVRDALRHYDLIDENKALQALTHRQNIELKDLNNNLEDKVAERTKEVEVLYKDLEQNFIDFVRVFMSLLELKSQFLGSHCKRVAALSRRLADKTGLPSDEKLDIEVASLLEDIGVLGFPEKMLRKRDSELDPTEKALLQQHPVLGQTTLQHIKKLLSVSLLIRHHHERYDGSGYPDNLRGERIPAGSRIIAIADFFDKLINPSDGGERYSVDRAFIVLEKESGRRFDPLLVGKFNEALHEFSHDVIEADTREIDVDELKEGMLLASDVRTKRGLLLMASGEVIKQVHLDKINNFHKIDPVIARISVKVRGNK
ncbi:MAG TPA: HD domain-containing phosphohydrolase [Nitrospirota bacterium]|nr:HD domain-containing phosphohydrolase [Nitrospirota bacterium]